jgi:hypothetical protein
MLVRAVPSNVSDVYESHLLMCIDFCVFRAMLFMPDVNGTRSYLIVTLYAFRYDPSPALQWLLLHHVITCEKTQKQSRTRTARTPMCTHLCTHLLILTTERACSERPLLPHVRYDVALCFSVAHCFVLTKLVFDLQVAKCLNDVLINDGDMAQVRTSIIESDSLISVAINGMSQHVTALATTAFKVYAALRGVVDTAPEAHHE